MEQLAHHRIAVSPSVRLHVVRAGAGAPLVLLHGWPELWLTWRRLIPRLAGSFDVVAPDLRGFGESPGAEEPATAEAHADDLEGLADALGLESFGLVSHDVGAYVAQAFARRRPERLSGLFFFNCPYPGIGRRWAEPGHIGEIWYQSFNQQPWAAELVGSSRDACRIYLRHFLAHWSHDAHAFDADLEAWVDAFMRPGVLQGGFDWYRAAAPARLALMRDGAPELPPIDVPTCVRWGASDPVLPVAWSDRLGDYFSDVDVEAVPEAGHFVHHERPDVAAAAIEEFFLTGRARRASRR